MNGTQRTGTASSVVGERAAAGRPPSAVRDCLAIDVHGHFGLYPSDPHHPQDGQLMTGDVETVRRRAGSARTRLTVVSSLTALLPRGNNDPLKGNVEAAAAVAPYAELRHWVVVDPLRPDTFRQAAEMLGSPRCAGIKIHPEEHVYPIAQHGAAIFKFAAERRAVVITHSGEKNSLPEDFVRFADAYPEVTLILSHLGHGWDGDRSHQVRAIQASRRGNIYVDTSSIASMIARLVEWAVAEVGADRILYGTDSPLYYAPAQRARIDTAEISDEAKRKILCENSERVLRLG